MSACISACASCVQWEHSLSLLESLWAVYGLGLMVYWGDIRIMENKMECAIVYCFFG